ncbi:MAG: hypothetical protein HPY69_18520 [Armatimonadetes bacterium]|nr:hypothetical protein [Armatimonadota bacterium]
MRDLLQIGWLLSCLLLGPATATLADGAVAVPNAGFEDVDEKTGLPLGWTAWAANNTCAFTLAMAHSGVACARVTDTSSTVSQGLRSPRVPIAPGSAYSATAWVRVTELQAGGFALYLEFWRGDQRIQDTAVSTTRAGEWTQLRVDGTAPPDADSATLLVYGGSATVGEAYFDDIALSAAP